MAVVYTTNIHDCINILRGTKTAPLVKVRSNPKVRSFSLPSAGGVFHWYWPSALYHGINNGGSNQWMFDPLNI